MGSDKLVLGVSLAAQLEAAYIREGYTLQDIDRMTGNRVLRRVRSLIRFPGSYKEGVEIVRTFDLDRPPQVPAGMKIVSNVNGGKVLYRERRSEGIWIAGFDRDLTRTAEREQCMLRDPRSDRDNAPVVGIGGSEWLTRLQAKHLVSARLLDHFLDDPHLIPHDLHNDWFNGGGTYVFWGTIYANEDGERYVRCLRTGITGGCNGIVYPVDRSPAWGEDDFAVIFRK